MNRIFNTKAMGGFLFFILLTMLVGCANLTKGSIHNDEKIFILPYFLDNGETGVYIAYSYDGYKFDWLNKGELIFKAPDWPGENLTRDPSILYHNGRYHMVWTTSWASKSIGYAYSDNLVEWSEPVKIDLWQAQDDVANTWAPELHWNESEQHFFILWSSTLKSELLDGDGSSNRDGRDHRAYITRTKDFKDFSRPELFYSTKAPEKSVIDPYITKDDRGTYDTEDDRWVMVIKNEMPKSQGGKNLTLVFSKEMEGPYASKLGPPIVGSGTSIVNEMAEGPSLIKHDGLWWLYWDAPDSEYSYCLATSPDLEQWTNRSSKLDMPAKSMRHGTVVIVNKDNIGFFD